MKTLLDHYWIVAGSTTQAYSSKRAVYVLVNDATYVAWLARGETPTRIPNETELFDALFVTYPAGLPSATLLSKLRAQAQAALDNDRSAELKLMRAVVKRLVTELDTLYKAVARPITSITRVTTTATVNTMGAHGLTTGASVTIFGADVAAYNGANKTITVTGASTFTYPNVSGNPATPATGSLFYSLSSTVPPIERTFAQAVTALKNDIGLGTDTD